jgi:hypothetical protein
MTFTRRPSWLLHISGFASLFCMKTPCADISSCSLQHAQFARLGHSGIIEPLKFSAAVPRTATWVYLCNDSTRTIPAKATFAVPQARLLPRRMPSFRRQVPLPAIFAKDGQPAVCTSSNAL